MTIEDISLFFGYNNSEIHISDVSTQFVMH